MGVCFHNSTYCRNELDQKLIYFLSIIYNLSIHLSTLLFFLTHDLLMETVHNFICIIFISILPLDLKISIDLQFRHEPRKRRWQQGFQTLENLTTFLSCSIILPEDDSIFNNHLQETKGDYYGRHHHS